MHDFNIKRALSSTVGSLKKFYNTFTKKFKISLNNAKQILYQE